MYKNDVAHFGPPMLSHKGSGRGMRYDKENKSVRVSIGKAESSICGPKAVILFCFA